MPRTQREFDRFYSPAGKSMFNPEMDEIPVWANRRDESLPPTAEEAARSRAMFGGRVSPGTGDGAVAPGLQRQPAGMFAPGGEPSPGKQVERGQHTIDLGGVIGDAARGVDRWARGVIGPNPEQPSMGPRAGIGSRGISTGPAPSTTMFHSGDMQGPPIESDDPGPQSQPTAAPSRSAARPTRVAADTGVMNDGPKPKAPGMMAAQPTAPQPGVPQPAGKNASDATATKTAADAYLAALTKSMEDDPEETPKEKQRRLQKALFVGGMSMMAASGKHDFMESLGMGGMAGAQASEAEEDKRKAKLDKKRGNAATLAKAGYDVSNDQRKAGLDDRRVTADEQRLIDERERGTARDNETHRHNVADEGTQAARARAEADRAANPRSTIRDQMAVYGELFDTKEPKQEGETDQAYKRRRADFVAKTMTERRGSSYQDREDRARTRLAKDPLYSMGTPEERRQRLSEEMASTTDDDDLGGGAPAASTTAAKGPAVGTIRNGYKYNGGDPNAKTSWAKVQ